jgi:hypothetical protein
MLTCIVRVLEGHVWVVEQLLKGGEGEDLHSKGLCNAGVEVLTLVPGTYRQACMPYGAGVFDISGMVQACCAKSGLTRHAVHAVLPPHACWLVLAGPHQVG